MRKEKRLNQIIKMVETSLSNLFQNQSELNLDEFARVVLEALMLLERVSIFEEPRRCKRFSQWKLYKKF